jgi:hypothetical protein
LLDAPATYRLIHLPPTPIAVQASAPSWVPFAAPVVITATTTHGNGALLTGGTVTGTITRPDESRADVTLFDDGQHQDGAAGDGVFGVEVAATSQGGAYSLQLISNGSYNGQPYQRSAVTTFLVGTAGADLTDQYADAPLDDDGDTFYEALVLTATLQVTVPGTYSLAAELHAGDTFIDLASTTVELAAGQPTITLRFSGHRLRAAGIDGPYAIRNVSLLDETAGTVLITAADEVHQTGAYDAGRFGEPYRIFLPAVQRE